MKHLNKTYIFAAMIGVGFLGTHMSTNAQSRVIQNEQSMAGYSESDTNVREYRKDEPQNYNNMNSGPKTRQKVNDELVEARKNGLLEYGEGDNYPQRWADYQNRGYVSKTRQQVTDELVEARKNGLLDYGESDNYPQKWIDYQNSKMYGTKYSR